MSDPAPSYQQLLQLMPMGFSLLEQNVLPQIAGGTLVMPFGLEDLPAAEMVTEPMFPNVTVGYSTENGIGSTTRQSVPANPMGNMSATVGVPILVACYCPPYSRPAKPGGPSRRTISSRLDWLCTITTTSTTSSPVERCPMTNSNPMNA